MANILRESAGLGTGCNIKSQTFFMIPYLHGAYSKAQIPKKRNIYRHLFKYKDMKWFVYSYDTEVGRETMATCTCKIWK